MRIQLKQNEIEEALKRYLAAQGISVTDKEVTMAFTSGRKNNGLSVEVMIEDPQATAHTAEAGVGIQQVYVTGDEYHAPATQAEQQAESKDPAEVKPAGSLFG